MVALLGEWKGKKIREKKNYQINTLSFQQENGYYYHG